MGVLPPHSGYSPTGQISQTDVVPPVFAGGTLLLPPAMLRNAGPPERRCNPTALDRQLPALGRHGQLPALGRHGPLPALGGDLGSTP